MGERRKSSRASRYVDAKAREHPIWTWLTWAGVGVLAVVGGTAFLWFLFMAEGGDRDPEAAGVRVGVKLGAKLLPVLLPGLCVAIPALLMLPALVSRWLSWRLPAHDCPSCGLRSRKHGLVVLSPDQAAFTDHDAELTCASCGHRWKAGTPLDGRGPE